MMMGSSILPFYPVIEGNTSNFVSDYLSEYAYLDRLINFNYGDRTFEYDSEDLMPGYWDDLVNSIVLKYIPSWARLYYALNENYNPLYNVDGTEVTTYGERTNTSNYGASTNTTEYGDTSISVEMGERNTTMVNGEVATNSIDYSMSYPNTTRHESGYNETGKGESTDTTKVETYTDTTTSDSHTDTFTNGAHTDTHQEVEHTDTIRRYGNIGVVSTTKLLEEQYAFYKRAFWDDVFKTIMMEVGLFYE